MFAAPALKQFVREESLPGDHVRTDDELLDYTRRNGGTSYHASCTCMMGSHAMAVVDDALWVSGIRGRTRAWFSPYPVPYSFAQRDTALAGAIPVGEGFEHLIEESRRQEAVIVAVAVRTLAQVVAWPEKFVAFGDDDPGGIDIEPEMAFDRQRDLDRRSGIGRRAVYDRQKGSQQ